MSKFFPDPPYFPNLILKTIRCIRLVLSSFEPSLHVLIPDLSSSKSRDLFYPLLKLSTGFLAILAYDVLTSAVKINLW